MRGQRESQPSIELAELTLVVGQQLREEHVLLLDQDGAIAGRVALGGLQRFLQRSNTMS